jgi:hypothetical protein
MSKGKRTKQVEQEPKQVELELQQEQRDRAAILDERENLRHLFPADYSPDISVCKDGRVEVMFKLTIPQARSLAWLLKEHHLWDSHQFSVFAIPPASRFAGRSCRFLRRERSGTWHLPWVSRQRVQ